MTKTLAEIEDWLAIRAKAALEIDPATAEIEWDWGYDADPYCTGYIHGTDKKLADWPDMQQVGRQFFACAPGSDIWVAFDDMPDDALKVLMKRLIERRSRAGTRPSTDNVIELAERDRRNEQRIAALNEQAEYVARATAVR